MAATDEVLRSIAAALDEFLDCTGPRSPLGYESATREGWAVEHQVRVVKAAYRLQLAVGVLVVGGWPEDLGVEFHASPAGLPGSPVNVAVRRVLETFSRICYRWGMPRLAPGLAVEWRGGGETYSVEVEPFPGAGTSEPPARVVAIPFPLTLPAGDHAGLFDALSTLIIALPTSGPHAIDGHGGPHAGWIKGTQADILRALGKTPRYTTLVNARIAAGTLACEDVPGAAHLKWWYFDDPEEHQRVKRRVDDDRNRN